VTTGERPARGWWAASLGLTLLVAILPQFALGALGPQLREDLGLTPADLGLVFAALYAIGVLGSPVAGPLVDRVGGRRSCVALLLTTGLALLLASVADSGSGLALAMVPAGAAMAVANPGTNRWASAAPSARMQATLVGVAQAGVQAGALVAGSLAAASAIGLDWRSAMRLGAVIALFGLVAAWRSPSDSPGSRRSGGPRAGLWSLPEPGAPRHLALYALLMGAGTSVVFAYLPTFGADVAGMSVAAAGALAIVYGGTALVCRVGLGVLLRRPDELARPLLVGMSVGAALAIAMISFGRLGPGWLWAGAVLFGATGTTWPAIAFLAVVRVSPRGEAGRTTGWVAAAFYLGLWVGPPVAGQMIAIVGYGPVWFAAAVCYLAALGPASAGRVAR
jgi:predicted MFS family arabinose efflux permease